MTTETTPESSPDAAPSADATAPLPVVAFIGLGHMGGPMAANLAAAGAEVRGFDLVPEALERAAAAGVTVVGSPAEAAQGAQVVLTMLPSGRLVHAVYTGDDDAPGVLQAAAPGTIFLDCSTIDVAEAREAARMAVEAGHRAADAPVSGGQVGAEAGTLAFMVGADPEVFAEVRPLLEVMGAKIVHCGPAGMGQAAKICNNMILGISMIGVSEAFVLAEKLGLEHQAMYDVVSQASGQCWSLTVNCPVPGPVPGSPANRDYTPGFAGALMDKDLGLALSAIEDTGVDARMGRLAREIYAGFAAGDGARQDFSGIIRTIRDASA